MTNKEAKDVLQEQIDRYGQEYDAEGIEALEIAINVLEQEPCEDAISRAEVINEIDRYIDKAQSTGTRDDFISFQELVVKQLPSVTPQPKTGRWIKVTNGRGGHECDLCHDYAPSYQSGKEYLAKYCPNCGAKMEVANDE